MTDLVIGKIWEEQGMERQEFGMGIDARHTQGEGTRRWLLLLSLASLLAVLTFGVPTATAFTDSPKGSAPDTRIPGRYIVVLEDSVTAPLQLAETQIDVRGGKLDRVYRYALKGYSAALPRDAVEALRNDPRVKYVAPDRRFELFAQTKPTGVDRTFASGRPDLDIDEIDDVRVNADVAVLDTGVDYLHPDLNVLTRTDCVVGGDYAPCVDNTGTDKLGHGTHVAGIVGALDNGFGSVGVAPGARIWSVRVLNDNGVPTATSIVSGIDWVTLHAADIEVANMSLGCKCSAPEIDAAITKAVNAGVVIVAAAGNADSDVADYTPPNNPDVLAVTALSDYDGKPGELSAQNCETNIKRGLDDTSAEYSNWGAAVDLAAPGTCIYSTLPTTGSLYGSNYGKLSGTSMAAPHAAGDAAIIASESNPNSRKDVEAIRQRLTDEGTFNWKDVSRDGVQEPLLDLRPTATDAVTTPPSPTPNGAVLAGFVNPGGLATSYRFEYGATTGYGSTTSVESAGSGIKDVKAKVAVDLKPNILYHYRISATNSSGTVYGNDVTVEMSRWSPQKAALPAGESKESELNGVSCSAANACTAVGLHKVATGTPFVALAQRWNGNQWLAQTTPSPAEGKESKLFDVSCPTATFCMAVGRYDSNFGKPLAEVWNGSQWSVLTVPTPVPTDPNVKANGVLNGVSCTSATSCVAVGQFVDVQQEPKGAVPVEEKTLVQRWDGSSWTIMSSPNRAGPKVSRLTDVSCTAATLCWAAGSSQATAGFGGSAAETLVMGWGGESWTINSTPNVAGSTESLLEDISCSLSRCLAVGNASTKTGLSGFVLTKDTGGWSLVSSGQTGPLNSVSCVSWTSCDAVGAGSGTKMRGEHWDGVELTPADLVTPYLGTQVYVRAVSCPQQNRCTAVGSKAEGSGPIPLVERSMPAVVSALSVGGEGAIEAPTAIATDPAGNAWVSEEKGALKYNSKGEYLGRLGSFGVGNGQFSRAYGIATTSSGDLWVVDQGNNRVQKFNSKGEYLSKFGSTGSGNGQFKSPTHLAIDSSGNIWVSDTGNQRVQEFSSTGAYIRTIKGGAGNGPELQQPYGLAINSSGQVWVADRLANVVLRYSSTGTYVSQFGSPGTGLGQLEKPAALAVRPSGELLVGDGTVSLANGRIQQFTPEGEFVTQFGAGKIQEPGGLALASGGAIWVSDRGTPNLLEKWVDLLPPGVGAGEATNVTSTGAKVSAAVNPGGLPTTYQFEYGIGSPAGTAVPIPGESIGSGFNEVKVSQTLAGLTPGATYRFRVAGTNAEGTSYGPEATFHTPWNGTARFETDQYPATVSSEQTTIQELKTQGGANFRCTSVTASGPLSAGSSALTLKPVFTGCKAFGGKATVNPNSCEYTLNVNNTGSPHTGKLDIACSKAGDVIKITPEAINCQIAIPAQTGVGAVAYAAGTSGSVPSVNLTFNLTGLTYTESSSGCSSPGTYANGTMTGGAMLKATAEPGPVGLYVTGAGS